MGVGSALQFLTNTDTLKLAASVLTLLKKVSRGLSQCVNDS
jgi:hypothetical protein